MRSSEWYRYAGKSLPYAIAKANELAGTKKDIDPIDWLNFVADEQRKFIDQKLFEMRGKKAFALSDISIPLMPNFGIDYEDANTYVADIICPVVDGDESRKFPVWDRRDANALKNLEMGHTSEPTEGFVGVSTLTYKEKPYGEQMKLPNQFIAEAPSIKGLFKKHSRSILGDLARAREKRCLDLVLTAANYASGCTSALTGTNRWDVAANTSTADPITDILKVAYGAAGLARKPNTMVIGYTAFNYLRTHPKVIAACGGKATDRRVAYNDLVELFELERIVVASAKYNSAGNASTPSYSFMAPKGCALIYVQPGAKMDELSFCKTFRHAKLRFETIEDRKAGVDGVTILKGTHSDAEKVVASDCGYLLDTVVS